MNFEDLQKAWQSQDAKVIDTAALWKDIRRKQQQFSAMILWRDAREVGVAFLLTLYFSYRGFRHDDWTDFLIAFACFGVGAFMSIDRLIQRSKQSAPNESLKACAETSLKQVNHQIWLLTNILWWYLLPIGSAVGISVCYSNQHPQHSGSNVVAGRVIAASVIILVNWGIYWLNQRAVRKELKPRQQELEALLASLNNVSK